MVNMPTIRVQQLTPDSSSEEHVEKWERQWQMLVLEAHRFAQGLILRKGMIDLIDLVFEPLRDGHRAFLFVNQDR